jgi:hypothetical protein
VFFFSFAQGLKVGYTCSLLEAMLGPIVTGHGVAEPEA